MGNRKCKEKNWGFICFFYHPITVLARVLVFFIIEFVFEVFAKKARTNGQGDVSGDDQQRMWGFCCQVYFFFLFRFVNVISNPFI